MTKFIKPKNYKDIKLPYGIEPKGIKDPSVVMAFRCQESLKLKLEDFADEQNISVGFLIKSLLVQIMETRTLDRLKETLKDDNSKA